MKLGPDTYAMLRNTTTFEAYREHRRRARRTSQPFLAIASVFFCVVIGVVVWSLSTGLRADTLRTLVMPMNTCIVIGGFCFAVAGIRIGLWQRTHPDPSGRPDRQAEL